MKRILLTAALTVIAAGVAPAVVAEDLWDVYQLALDNDPQIRDRRGRLQ